MFVLGPLAVLARGLDDVSQPAVVRRQGARVAEGAEVLARVEAECGQSACGAGDDAVALGSVRLAGVLEEDEIVPLGERHERAHVRHLPVEVDGQQEARPLSDCGLDCGDVDVPVGLRHVHGDRSAARLRHGLQRRDERVRGDDHLVAGLDPGGDQAEAQCVEAAREADRVGGPNVGGERLLELADLRAVDERPAVDQRREGLEQVVL